MDSSQKKITWQGEPLNFEDGNDMRFKKCMETIANLKSKELIALMGKEWIENYRRLFA
jgi:hypothetical protein